MVKIVTRFDIVYKSVDNLHENCPLASSSTGIVYAKIQAWEVVILWVEYNPNPAQPRAGDCAVRAVAKALDLDWEDAYAKIAINGFLMGDVISSNSVWGSVLRQSGFVREIVPNTCPDCYTLADFAKDHPVGTFVVALPNHVATVVDGDVYDSWNSLGLLPLYYWRKE